ncbi:MAG: DUF2905 domain-containing protein [Bacteroidota bacterium]|jgi:H+/Cl- antiporter ClcA
MQTAGKYIIIAGVALVIIGIIVYFFGNRLGWFGNLPGDIRYESDNTRIYFPVTTMILVSLALSLALWLIRKFME